MTVPSSPAAGGLDLMWRPEHYAPTIHGSGAYKLSSSAVAPLVAIAHGYRTIEQDDLKELFRAKGIAAQSTQARQLRSAVGDDGDALLMPWYGASAIGNAEQHRRHFPEQGEIDLAETSLQLRPARPRTNEKTGKPVKYELLAGHPTPLGFHPGMPADWLSGSPTMFITEGALKADSALTAYLLSVGIGREELSDTCEGDTLAARTKLREIMSTIPEPDRILIMALVGVGTWHKHPDWSNLKLDGVDVWIAFDADVSTNPDVWREANALWKKIGYERGRAHLLNVPSVGGEKAGVDDYLALDGDWDDLIANLSRELPKAPARREQAKRGEMRIDSDRLVTLKNEPTDNDFGQKVDTWVEEYRFAGRVKRIKLMRTAEPEEMRTGKTNQQIDPAQLSSEVEIELSWLDSNGRDVVTAGVLGTGSTLADPPEQWHRRGALVPPSITAHPDWPPKAEWLKAMKDHRREEIEHTNAWEQMGWVPTDNGNPVFIAGRDVLGPNGLVESASIASPGIDESRLSGAHLFGLEPAESPDAAREAFEKVIPTYLRAWTNPAHAAVVLACAIRPVAPQPPRVAALFSGSAGAGKTYSISSALHFWQSKPGVFKGRTLGAVADTFAATEYAISRVPIWGVDDLAPSPDGRKADSDEAKVTDLIRAIHNDSPKRRMNADMTGRAVNNARVMAMFSAENPLSSISAMQRVIHVRVTNGFLSADFADTEALDQMVSDGYEVNHVLAACIQYVQRRTALEGWEEVTRDYQRIYDGMVEEARRVMNDAKDSKRAAKNAADLGLGLRILLDTAYDLGVSDELEDTIESLFEQLYEIAAEGYRAKKEENAGVNAVRAVALALSSGVAHITGFEDPGAPPMDAKSRLGEYSAEYLNQQLGWTLPSRQEDAAHARGTRIGTMIRNKEGEPVVLLSPDVAFSVAQKAFPKLLQHGMKSSTAWETAWSEGVLCDSWARKQTSRGGESVVVRAKGIMGVPVLVSTLLEMSGAGSFDDESENESTTPS